MILDGQCNRSIFQDGIENIHVHIDVESLLLSVFYSLLGWLVRFVAGS